MAVKFELRTFRDIYTAVIEELAIPSNDTTIVNRIKRDVNIVYLDEVLPFANWWWARSQVDLQHQAFVTTGTLSVTEGSKSFTFSSAPADSQELKYIKIDGHNEIYTIRSHVAAATAAVLTVDFTGTTNTVAPYKVYDKSLPLPSDCKETFEVWHDFDSQVIEGIGQQEMRRIESANPFFEGRPRFYTTGDFRDPDPYSSISGLPSISTRASSGLIRTIKFSSTIRSDTNDSTTRRIDVGDRLRIRLAGKEDYNIDSICSSVTTTDNTDDTVTYTALEPLQESAVADATMTITKANVEGAGEAYRRLLIYPHLFDEDTTLHIDYIRQIDVMLNDTDEPILPIEDRVVILYGALSRAWVKARNDSVATGNFALFQNKLGRMKAKLTDSKDNPQIVPNKRYLETKRSILAINRTRRFWEVF